MRKLFTLLAFIVITILNAQAPQGFNYQATVRNSSGTLISNQNVYFKFNIMLNSQTSVPVYSEIHYVPTDDMGQVNLIVGQGTPTIGTFTVINWANGTYYLGIELNTGTGYVAMGTTQLLSVPYALYANSSGNSEVVTPNLASVLALNNGANNLQIKNLADPTDGQDAVTNSFLTTQIANLQSQITALQNPTPIMLPTVIIGTQTWTTKNLDVTTYSDGTVIPEVTDPNVWQGLTTGAWCYYNNDVANGETYGKLYNWYAVAGIWNEASIKDTSQRKKLAPTGYHIPSENDEWATLTTFLGGFMVAGGKMKETLTKHWKYPNTSATNSSGFTGLPGGFRFPDGTFANIGGGGNWWSSSEVDTMLALYRILGYNFGSTNELMSSKSVGYSVRCLSD